jgi:hypothetical protein
MPPVKTSIAPAEEPPKSNRSACFARLEKGRLQAQDAEIINANAERLNREAMDVLEYQGPQPRARVIGSWLRMQ